LKTTFVFIMLLASSAMAFTEYDTDGAIAAPGYDYTASNYTCWRGDSRVAEQLSRFDASYVAINDQIPSQMIIVTPKSGSAGFTLIDDSNIERAARNFLLSNQLISANYDLELISSRFVLNRVWFVKFLKSVNGARVLDAGIGLAISPRGKVNLLWGSLDISDIPVSEIGQPRDAVLAHASDGISGEITNIKYDGNAVLPLYLESGVVYRPVYRVIVIANDPYSVWETLVDIETGEPLQRKSLLYYDNVSGSVSGAIQPRYPFDPWEDRNFFNNNLIFDGSYVATTDSNGEYSLELPGSNPVSVDAYLRGPYLEVWNSAGGEAYIGQTVDPPASLDIYWNEDNSLPAERDVWYSGVTVHNWIRRLDPDLIVMDFPMECNVYVIGNCNAYWSSWDSSINFYMAGGQCNNTAQIADVVYHEYGHGVTNRQTRPLEPNGAMHEGFSDYLACSITNQPVVGRGFYSTDPNGSLRTLDNTRRYPEDWHGESHEDGLIIGGALWHTRTALSPYSMGYVDTLWHFARYALCQEFEPYFWALVELDDDDGNLDNGTPNAWNIFHNFGDRHGIGPGTVITLSADTLFDSEDTTLSYTIDASVSTIFAPNPDSIILYYDNGGGFQPMQMVQIGSQWRGVIPPQHNNTHINYYVLAVDVGGFRGTWPSGAPNSYYSFYVGPEVIPPTLSLVESPPNTINRFGPYGPFVAHAFDIEDINPSQTRLHYYVNHESETVFPMVPGINDGEFVLASLDLDRQLTTGDTLHYYFTAMDEARQPNTGRLPSTGAFGCAMVTTEVFETFEQDGIDNWTYDDGWVLRDDGYYSTHSIWYASPLYPNNANASIEANAVFDLSPFSEGRVGFYTRGGIRTNDSCLVEISNDNGLNWFKSGFITAQQITGFQYREFDIAPALNHSVHQYRFRIRFVTDSDSNWVGLIIDNITWIMEPALGIENGVIPPRPLSLGQNYPNPFNPETNIEFALSLPSQVRLEIFDILGRNVTTLIDQRMNAGRFVVTWKGVDGTGSQVASGVYFYRLTTEQEIRQEKMVLLR